MNAALQLALTVGAVLAYLYVFWLLYVLVMGLYRAHLAGRLGPVNTALALPAVVVAYLVDLAANYTIAAALFRQWPQQPLELVTDRLSRYLVAERGYRYQLARWVCHTLLDPLDPTGQHCR